MPPDADTSFVPVAWRGSVQSNEPRRRRTWEISLALTLKDALRSGDVFLPDSRRHVSFWHLCYDESTWQHIRASAFDTLGLPTDGTAAVKAWSKSFDTAAQTERDWASIRLSALRVDVYVYAETHARAGRWNRGVAPVGTARSLPGAH